MKHFIVRYPQEPKTVLATFENEQWAKEWKDRYCSTCEVIPASAFKQSPSTLQWVKVEDGLPELPPPYQEDGHWLRPVSAFCLASDGEDVFTASYDESGFNDPEVTHWMHLPKPPSEYGKS